MHVVIVSDFAAVNGGAAKVAIDSARGLAEAGVDVTFACAVGDVSPMLDHPNITVERFAMDDVWQMAGKLAAARQGIWNAPAQTFLKQLFARVSRRDSVIHLHQWTKAFSPSALAAAGESGLPVFVTMHDYFSFCPAGGYYDFQKSQPCTKAPMGTACISANCDRASYAHKLVRVARQWGSNRALNDIADLTFVHVSAFARQFAEPYLPEQARHVTVENMIEARQRPAVDVARNGHVLYLGRLTQEKGVVLLAEAARKVGMPVRFVGDGPMADEIRAANPDAELTGWLSAEEVAGQIDAARALVAPSLWYETGPLTVPEAMARGVPCIASTTMGASDWIVDGASGFLVKAASRDALAAALRSVSDATTVSWLGASAYDSYWAVPLTTERHVRRLMAIYGAAPLVDAQPRAA